MNRTLNLLGAGLILMSGLTSCKVTINNGNYLDVKKEEKTISGTFDSVNFKLINRYFDVSLGTENKVTYYDADDLKIDFIVSDNILDIKETASISNYSFRNEEECRVLLTLDKANFSSIKGKVSNGEISFNGFIVNDMNIDLPNGEVDINNCSGDSLYCDVDNGKIAVNNTLFNNCDYELSNGEIALTYNAEQKEDVVSNYSLDLECNLGIVSYFGSSEGRNFKKTSDSSKSIKAKVSNGAITVK